MANGTAAIALLPLPETPAPQPLDEPIDERFGGAEGWIEPIVIALVEMAVGAAREIQAGGVAPDTRLKGGDMVAQLALLQSRIGARAFAAAVHRVRPRRSVPMDAGMADDIIAVVAEVATHLSEMN